MRVMHFQIGIKIINGNKDQYNDLIYFLGAWNLKKKLE